VVSEEPDVILAQASDIMTDEVVTLDAMRNNQAVAQQQGSPSTANRSGNRP
jgi:hypothetical protein